MLTVQSKTADTATSSLVMCKTNPPCVILLSVERNTPPMPLEGIDQDHSKYAVGPMCSFNPSRSSILCPSYQTVTTKFVSRTHGLKIEPLVDIMYTITGDSPLYPVIGAG